MAEILVLATAGLKPDQLADTDHVRYPRVDYIELERHLDINVLDYTAYDRTPLGEFFRRLEIQLRSDLYLTMSGLLRRHRYHLIFAMSERAGIPFAALNRVVPNRKPLVSMFTCWSSRQESTITRLNLFSAMDTIVVKCQSLKDHFLELGAPAERVHVIPFGLDHHFFSPLADVEQQAGFAMSLGETRTRDYATLFQAVDGLPLKLLVAASGSWYAREKNADLQTTVPDNVTIARGFSRAELKKLYAQSQFIVLPLPDVLFSAGATAILEAMCLGRAVIVTRSRGILDYVTDGETAILVSPGDVVEMREAIQDLLAHPEKARRLGQNARQRIDDGLNLDVYVERIAGLLRAHL
jgi:glycosyltransferase involved in cell wall biosynthesis